MASTFVHTQRITRSMEKGSVEARPSWQGGGYMVWKAGKGYLSKSSGFTKNPAKALVVSGPGEAIQRAAANGFAITSW